MEGKEDATEINPLAKTGKKFAGITIYNHLATPGPHASNLVEENIDDCIVAGSQSLALTTLENTALTMLILNRTQ